MQKAETPQKIYLKDYRAPDFSIDKLELDFVLEEDFSRVRSTMTVRKQMAGSDLWLDGEDLKLISVLVNGVKPTYELSKTGLKI
ncbi:MAG: hypothetical protein ACXWC9_04625, partial [Pseudobdellovibrionaceae bacterium]